MIVIPIVVSSLIVGVAGAGSGKRSAGSAFGRSFTLNHYDFAIVLGLLLGNIIQPGHGVNFLVLKTGYQPICRNRKEASTKSVADTFLHIVPTTFPIAR
ncbi:cation:dicarboxylase symporter family transporter [Bacillus licheniformis]|nr:cation:dicarboxylase symporter family transporter [Bacillus licheniformis]